MKIHELKIFYTHISLINGHTYEVKSVDKGDSTTGRWSCFIAI
jgi:hypothetical protein